MYTIAITGAGGGVGQSVLKALRNSGYNLISLDGDALGTGLYASGKSYKIPYAKTENYIPALLEICARENCHLLFPGLDAELLPLSVNKEKFSAIGTNVVVSHSDLIEISDNKLKTFVMLDTLGVRVPFTAAAELYIANGMPLEFPMVIKQNMGGARSKNVYIIKSERELFFFLKVNKTSLSEYVIQEYIEGDEYTCGSICFGGECKGIIVLRRILRDGDTYKCFVERNDAIENTVRTIVNHFKPFGALNVQLKLKNGIPYVFELNARCSGTTASRALCGFNEPQMIADYLLKKEEPAFSIEEKTILRYWNELIVQNEDIATLQKEGVLVKENYTKL